MLVKQPGKVILASDLCCSNSLSSLLNRKTLKARCNKPSSMFEFKWQFFFVSAPIFSSFSSIRMHISERSWICFSSRLSVFTSGIVNKLLEFPKYLARVLKQAALTFTAPNSNEFDLVVVSPSQGTVLSAAHKQRSIARPDKNTNHTECPYRHAIEPQPFGTEVPKRCFVCSKMLQNSVLFRHFSPLFC